MNLLLALLLLASDSPDPDLAAAALAVEEGRFEAVLPALESARRNALTPAEQVRAFELEAFTAAAFDDVLAERSAFDGLLALDPNHALPRRAGPKMQAIFLEAQRARRPAAPPAAVARSEPRIHLTGLLTVQLNAPRAIAADVSATYSVRTFLDAGLGVAIGKNPAPELILELHPNRTHRVTPFFQVRGLAAWPAGKVAWGAGAWAGADLALGPGRVRAGLAGELYQAPDLYSQAALLLFAGYALDL